ncbi:Sterol biosynthesis ERG24/DHCR-like - like 3 [Theobroma cacao]|nr:Sterol biosynthesis ERG24/DHCR-like - like 3 [Theobroma cacao]
MANAESGGKLHQRSDPVWPFLQIEATYTTTSGETKTSLLLTSGWWGLSRHFHYVPEILAAFFWTVPALFNHFLPYFYVVFLTILLFDRAKRDDDRCRSKHNSGNKPRDNLAWEPFYHINFS